MLVHSPVVAITQSPPVSQPRWCVVARCQCLLPLPVVSSLFSSPSIAFGEQRRVECEDVGDCAVPKFEEADLGRAVLLPRPVALASHGQSEGAVKWTVLKLAPYFVRAGISTDSAAKPIEAVIEVVAPRVTVVRTTVRWVTLASLLVCPGHVQHWQALDYCVQLCQLHDNAAVRRSCCPLREVVDGLKSPCAPPACPSIHPRLCSGRHVPGCQSIASI